MDIDRDIGTEEMRVEEVKRVKRQEEMLKDRVKIFIEKI